MTAFEVRVERNPKGPPLCKWHWMAGHWSSGCQYYAEGYARTKKQAVADGESFREEEERAWRRIFPRSEVSA